ncbi:MAG: pseudouridine synthase, partial [bacterium]
LMHPRHRFSKTYLAKVRGVPTEERLEKLRRGVNIEGVRTAPAEVRMVAVKEKNSLVEVVLREGRNRQVKRMFLEIGHPVIRLHRSAYAFLDLEGLAPAQWRQLEVSEVKRLRDSAARAGSAPAAESDGFRPRLKRPIQSSPREGSTRPKRTAGGTSGSESRSGSGAGKSGQARRIVRSPRAKPGSGRRTP